MGKGTSSSRGVACLLVDLSLGSGLQGLSGAGAARRRQSSRGVVILVSRGTESLRCGFECPQLRLGWRDNPGTHRLALSMPVRIREASTGESRTKQKLIGSTEQAL